MGTEIENLNLSDSLARQNRIKEILRATTHLFESHGIKVFFDISSSLNCYASSFSDSDHVGLLVRKVSSGTLSNIFKTISKTLDISCHVFLSRFDDWGISYVRCVDKKYNRKEPIRITLLVKNNISVSAENYVPFEGFNLVNFNHIIDCFTNKSIPELFSEYIIEDEYETVYFPKMVDVYYSYPDLLSEANTLKLNTLIAERKEKENLILENSEIHLGNYDYDEGYESTESDVDEREEEYLGKADDDEIDPFTRLLIEEEDEKDQQSNQNDNTNNKTTEVKKEKREKPEKKEFVIHFEDQVSRNRFPYYKDCVEKLYEYIIRLSEGKAICEVTNQQLENDLCLEHECIRASLNTLKYFNWIKVARKTVFKPRCLSYIIRFLNFGGLASADLNDRSDLINQYKIAHVNSVKQISNLFDCIIWGTILESRHSQKESFEKRIIDKFYSDGGTPYDFAIRSFDGIECEANSIIPIDIVCGGLIGPFNQIETYARYNAIPIFYFPKEAGGIVELKKKYFGDRIDYTLYDLKRYFSKARARCKLTAAYEKPMTNEWLAKMGSFEAIVDWLGVKGIFTDEEYNVFDLEKIGVSIITKYPAGRGPKIKEKMLYYLHVMTAIDNFIQKHEDELYGKG